MRNKNCVIKLCESRVFIQKIIPIFLSKISFSVFIFFPNIANEKDIVSLSPIIFDKINLFSVEIKQQSLFVYAFFSNTAFEYLLW